MKGELVNAAKEVLHPIDTSNKNSSECESCCKLVVNLTPSKTHLRMQLVKILFSHINFQLNCEILLLLGLSLSTPMALFQVSQL